MSVYLTCAVIDPLHPSTRQALGDCCDMHRNVMKLFSTTRAEGSVLYRVGEAAGEKRLYLTSQAQPQLAHAAWLYYGQNARQRELSPLLDSFTAGRVYGFDLLTYPSKKIVADGKVNSVRTFLRTEEERQAWLVRQGKKNGFALCAYHEDMPYDLRGTRKTGVVQIRAMRLTGILRVTDGDAFRAGYINGIGPEKAYGLGMLMLKRG